MQMTTSDTSLPSKTRALWDGGENTTTMTRTNINNVMQVVEEEREVKVAKQKQFGRSLRFTWRGSAWCLLARAEDRQQRLEPAAAMYNTVR